MAGLSHRVANVTGHMITSATHTLTVDNFFHFSEDEEQSGAQSYAASVAPRVTVSTVNIQSPTVRAVGGCYSSGAVGREGRKKTVSSVFPAGAQTGDGCCTYGDHIGPRT